jgi:hypothetical protein
MFSTEPADIKVFLTGVARIEVAGTKRESAA